MGLTMALEELSLVLFTTLAPAGTLAYLLMLAVMLCTCPDKDESAQVSKMLALPIVVTMAGLVASATHLGNPANALYVFAGVGRSPLSNEVVSAVVFLGLAGMTWLHSFAEHSRFVVSRLLMFSSMFGGLVFILLVSLAYSVPTIMTWDTVYTPLCLWANALAAGPLLALLGLSFAKQRPGDALWGRVLFGMSILGFAAGLLLYALQWWSVSNMSNFVVSVQMLVPGYAAMIAAYAVFGMLSVVARSRKYALTSTLLAFAAIFIMRFGFYMLHMTV